MRIQRPFGFVTVMVLLHLGAASRPRAVDASRNDEVCQSVMTPLHQGAVTKSRDEVTRAIETTMNWNDERTLDEGIVSPERSSGMKPEGELTFRNEAPSGVGIFHNPRLPARRAAAVPVAGQRVPLAFGPGQSNFDLWGPRSRLSCFRLRSSPTRIHCSAI